MSGMDEQKEQEEAVPPVAVASSSFLDYDAAVAALYSDTHQATTRDAIRAAGARRHRTVDDMHEYMRRLGLLSLMITDENNNNNNNMWKNKRLIHITGTKGKGSTAAMCECICRRGSNHAKVAQAGGGGGWTTGLFTSPHLMDIRERIRINGKPVAKQIFAQAYWTIRRRLENYKPKTSCNAATTKDEYDDSNDDNLPILPGYFRMLSLLAMFIFTHHQEPVIDVIILEVGLGGRYDATNVLDLDLFHTSACGVTLIDYDHCRILGHSLEEIAWEKGGIFQVVKKQQPQNESTSTTTTTTTTTPRPVPAKDSSTPSIATTHKSQEKADSQRRQLDHKERNRTTTTNERVFYSMDSNTDAVLDVLRACAFNEGRGGRLVAVSSSSSHRQWNSRNGKDDDMDKSSTANTHTTTTTARRHPPPLVLGLHGEHQWENAALAVALCKHVMNRNDDDEDADNEMYQALVHVSWPGRCQTIHHDKHNNMSFFVDGAHTVQSIKAGLEWFQQQQQQQQKQQQQQQQQIATAQAETSNSSHECSRPRRRLRALIFNCSHEREPVQLLHLLLRGGGGDDCHGLKQHHDDVSGTDHGSSFGFDVVLFCRSNTDRPSSVDKANAIDLLKAAGYPGQEQDAVSMTETGRTWQDTLLTVWKYLVQHELIQQQATSTGSTTMAAAAAAHITESNLTALEALRRLEGIMADKNNQEFSRLDVFVTGSLYLAGSMLEALEWTEMSQTEGSLAISLAGD